MDENDRLDLLIELDDEFLQGGVMLSEWCVFIVREADVAFTNGAHLASIITAVSGIETYLRSEYAESKRKALCDLIDASPIDSALKEDIHILRKYRNKWVHVDEPWNDNLLLENPDVIEKELEEMAFFAVRVLRKTIYENPGV